MSMTKYQVRDHDTWSTIAWKAYADPSNTAGIIAANPTQPVRQPLGGTTIFVPVLQSTEADLVNNQALPPWKRTTA